MDMDRKNENSLNIIFFFRTPELQNAETILNRIQNNKHAKITRATAPVSYSLLNILERIVFDFASVLKILLECVFMLVYASVIVLVIVLLFVSTIIVLLFVLVFALELVQVIVVCVIDCARVCVRVRHKTQYSDFEFDKPKHRVDIASLNFRYSRRTQNARVKIMALLGNKL